MQYRCRHMVWCLICVQKKKKTTTRNLHVMHFSINVLFMGFAQKKILINALDAYADQIIIISMCVRVSVCCEFIHNLASAMLYII